MGRIILLLVFMTMASYIFALRQTRCLALAMEGGGTKGTYQAGVFKALADLLSPEEVRYDVVAGASVGSLNSLLIGATEIGKEKEAALKLTEIWNNIKSNDVLEWWPYVGPLQGFFGKTSFFDTSPLLPFVQKQFDILGGKLHRRLSFGMVDAQTGSYHRADEKHGADMPKKVVASASVPAFFPYVIDGEHVFIDGGSTDNINLRGAIDKCMEIVGEDYAAITIDIIIPNPYAITYYDMSKEGTYDLYFRGNDLRFSGKDIWYLRDTIHSYPEINWRYIVMPKEGLPNYPYVPLSFDQEKLRKSQEQGYKDGTEAVKGTGPNILKQLKEVKSYPRVRLT